MADNLTLKLKQELAKRGKIVTDAQVESFLNKKSQQVSASQAPQSPQTSQQNQYQFPDWYNFDEKSKTDNTLSNALGVGLWSFADSALFGVPGALVEEEEMLDFEDPLAKWLGAVGSFAGYIGGAPMKIGLKASRAVASNLAPKMVGKQGINTVVKGMREVGKEGGLSNQAIKQATGGYRSLVQRSQTDKMLQGEKFGEAVAKYRDEYIEMGLENGIIRNKSEAETLRKMFLMDDVPGGFNVFKRPVQDLQSLAIARYGDDKLGRFIGHAANDIMIFSMIDTIFEGVSMYEDQEFDWTAPLWGAANGIAFSSLSFLNPRGKSSSWLKDFRVGVRAAFGGKSPYGKLSEDQLAGVSRYIGKARKENGESSIVDVTYKGKTESINLTPMGDHVGFEFGSSKTLQEIKEKFKGENASEVMKSFLEKERKKFGREIMKWSTRDEAANLVKVWPRMVAGGLLFNSQAFYHMYANDQDLDFANDILPNFLIGAFIQRKTNPAKFDLSPTKMNEVRQNLALLGFDSGQLSEVPSLQQPQSRFRNPLYTDKYKTLIDLAEKEGIISDEFTDMETPLTDVEASVGLPDNRSVGFEQIYGWLKGIRAYQKPLDNISTDTANKILNEWKKIDPNTNLDSVDSVEKMLDTESLKMTEEFESNFPSIIASLKSVDELNIIEEADGKASKLKTPEHVMVSGEIIKLAREGKLDWLEAQGEEAVTKLMKSFDGLNAIVKTAFDIDQIKINESPDFNSRTIANEENARKIYETITTEEVRIDGLYPDNSSMGSKFSFTDNFNDYRFAVTRNYAIRTAQGITDIFKPSYDKAERDTLIRYMKDSGLITFDGPTANPLLVNNVDQIKFKESGDAEKDAERRRFLGRVLAIQSVVGNYDRTNLNVDNVDGSKIDTLRTKLSELGYNESKMPLWMHKHIMDFAFREKIEGTKLQLSDVDGIMSLSSLGMASVGVDITGQKTSGFSLKLIDTTILNEGSVLVSGLSEADIVSYNERVRQIQERSNGLVTVETDPVLVTDMGMLKIMVDSLNPEVYGNNPDASSSAKGTLMEFINLVGTSDVPGSKKFQEQLGRFIEENGPEAETRALSWLNEAGLISLKKGERKFEVDLKDFNDKVALRLGERIDRYGVTPEYAERIYETLEKNSRDRQMLDSGEGDYIKTLTMQEFFERYRVDGKAATPSNNQEETINKILFDAWEGKIVPRAEVIDNLFNRLYVNNVDKNDWVKFTDLPNPSQQKFKASIYKDIVALIGGRLKQKGLDVLEFKNGKLRKSKEVKQTTRYDLLLDDLGIKHYSIDPFITTYIFSPNGRRIQRKRVNVFGNTTNLPKYTQNLIDSLRQNFDSNLNIATEIEGVDIRGPFGETGLASMRLAPNMNPIAVPFEQLRNIKSKFDEFADIYTADESPLKQEQKNIIKDIRKALQQAEDDNRLATTADYSAALRRLMLKDMLVGSDGDKLFADFMNGNISSIDKLFARTKLYDTKKFVKYDSDFILDVADGLKSIGDKNTERVLRKRLRKNNFGVVVWNDEQTADVRTEVNQYIKDNNIDFDLDKILGDAHKDVSSFDSIAYVSKDVLKFFHTMMGHNPNSPNPIKPVISSGGVNSPLLMGKTLFVYSKDLDGFFNKQGNRDVDIILSSSGAKALNADIQTDSQGKQFDNSLINNVEWADLNNFKVSGNHIRRISLDSIGVKPEKDVILSRGKKSHADMNYANNDEAARYFADEIEGPLNKSIRNAQEQIKNPISTRQWIRDQFGDESLISMVDGNESLNNLNGLGFFAGLTRDANPMSYSESMVKNKIYGAYIDPLINNKRAVTNQFDQLSSTRYGGQASLIQAPINYSHNKARLRPTLVDDSGMISRGEVVLPFVESQQKIAKLISDGYQIKIVENDKIHDPSKIFEELKEDWNINLDLDINLGELHELIETLGAENNRPDLQVGIIVRRNPRTRPNDLTLMGLKGFLDEAYGNSMMINSLDVVNVFEGDYDADKADYFFAERQNMYEHIERTSQYFVQGIDPTKFMRDSGFTFTRNTTDENDMVEKMAADLDLYKSSIGLVQKVPRMLNYLGSLGQDVPTRIDENGNKVAIQNSMIGEESSKILYEGSDYKIVMDYDNLDFYLRSALETQYIIDGKGDLNQDIASDIFSWRDEFLFPSYEKSKSSSQLRQMDNNERIGFHQEMSKNGSRKGERIRIFKKITKQEDGTFTDVEDIGALDKAIIKELLSEYGKLLQVTGPSAYENSGEQRRVTYDDIMTASDRFFKFNQNLRKSLYYRLRNKYQDFTLDNEGNAINKDKWKDSEEFKQLFGVATETATKGKNTFSWQVTKNEKMFNNTITKNSKEFASGERGSPIERTLHRLWDANIFEESRVETLTGQTKEAMNDWYDEFVFDSRMSEDNLKQSSNMLKSNVLQTTFDINQKINLIKSLNKKVMQIKFNKSLRWDRRKKAMDTINALKEDVQKEVKKFLKKEYFQSMSSKDLDNIEFVDVNTSNMKKGAIYYSTLEQIKRFMPLINGTDGFGLNESAINDISQIKQYRKLFYGSQDRLGEIYKYGAKQVLSSEQQRLLEQFPDQSTYTDIETELLFRGVNKHGLKFLWGFMQPSLNKKSIGVFEGNPIAVPFEAKEGYDPSSRYRRGLNFLTQLAMRDSLAGQSIDYEIKGTAKTALAYIQATEAQFERFFNKRFDMKNLVSDNLGDAYLFGDKAQKKLIYDAIRLPNFHKDFEQRFGDFGTIQWTKTGDRIKNGFGLFNDHLFNFYRDIMSAAGKEKEFDTYLEQMSTLQDLMMSNNVLNPIAYVHARNKMDVDIRDIAQKTLGQALKQGNLAPEVTTKLQGNPVYALMGGSTFFKNLNLERPARKGFDSLKELHAKAKAVENVKKDLPIDETSEERFRKLKDELIEIEKCNV